MTCNITVIIIRISSSRMTCLTTGFFVGHLSTWFLPPLQLVFGLIIHKRSVSISTQNHLSTMTSKFPAAITDCQMETFNLSSDHGLQLKSPSLRDDSADFHYEHFVVQICLVVHHFSHSPNFERQSRVSDITFSNAHDTEVTKSTENYSIAHKINDHTQQALFCVFYICGLFKRRRRAASNSNST